MDSTSNASIARQSERSRSVGFNPRVKRTELTRVWALILIYWCAAGSCLIVSAEPDPPAGQVSSEISGLDFVIRLRNGQTKFRQGEIISVELGYGVTPQAPVKEFAGHPDRPGLSVDRFVLSPHTGVVDPLRDFLSTVGGWDGPPPRSVPFLEAGGSWATADINQWFRFDNPGKYSLSVLAHAVRTRYEAFGNRPTLANTLKSNTVEFEIVPAEEAWQAATLQKALTLLEGKSALDTPHQICRVLRFLATPQAVDNMVKLYADQVMCESEYRDGLFAFPDREYAVKKLEDGLLDPSIAASAGYLDTLARLSACLQRPELLPAEDEQYFGSSEWTIGGPLGLWQLVEEEQNRFARIAGSAR